MYQNGVSGQIIKKQKQKIGGTKYDPTAHLQGNKAPFVIKDQVNKTKDQLWSLNAAKPVGNFKMDLIWGPLSGSVTPQFGDP